MPQGRTSQEVRGLKYSANLVLSNVLVSHLARGAWIEIKPRLFLAMESWSHLARGAWIEIAR